MPFLHKQCNTKHYNSNKYVRIKPREGFIPVMKKDKLYEGYWHNGDRGGFGMLSKMIKNKTFIPKYKGNWYRDKRHGEGNGYYVDEGYYVGQWKRGMRYGYGRMWYSDGSFYDGDWKCDKRDGQGLFVAVNGNRYEGKWSNDMKQGFGRFFHLSTGQMQEGVWFENTAVCTTMEDIPFRQTAVYPTEYPINPIELQKPHTILINEQLNYLTDEDKSSLQFQDELSSGGSEESILIRMSVLQEKYKYV